MGEGICQLLYRDRRAAQKKLDLLARSSTLSQSKPKERNMVIKTTPSLDGYQVKSYPGVGCLRFREPADPDPVSLGDVCGKRAAGSTLPASAFRSRPRTAVPRAKKLRDKLFGRVYVKAGSLSRLGHYTLESKRKPG